MLTKEVLRRPIVKKWLITFIFAYLFIALFPHVGQPFVTGLDGGWQWAINFLPSSEYVFGRDVIFTFGPLGFILRPMHMGSNLEVSLFVNVLVHVLTIGLCFAIANESDDIFTIVAFAILLLFACSMITLFECRIQFLMALLGCYPLICKRFCLISTLALGILAPFSLCMRFDLGVSGLLIIIISVFCWRIRSKEKAHALIKSLAFTCISAFAFLSIWLFRSLDNMALWLRGSSEIVSGYSDAMSIPASEPQLRLGIIIIVSYLLALILLALQKRFIFFPACIFAVPILINWKHSVTRLDVAYFIPLASLILLSTASLILFTRKRNETLVVIVCFSYYFLFCLMCFRFWLSDVDLPFIYQQKFSLMCGIGNIMKDLNLPTGAKQLDKISAENFSQLKLPLEITSAILKNNNTVDVIPINISYCPANNLTWNPNPLLQLYAAYTPYLDTLCAKHFSGPTAPKFLLAELIDIDDRHPFFSSPEVWQTVLNCYHQVALDKSEHLLLLRKNNFNSNHNIRLVSKTNCLLGNWIDVPEKPGLLYGQIKIGYSINGLIIRLLYQPPAINIHLKFASGKTVCYRMIPQVANNGLLLNYLPTSLAELNSLLNGTANDRIISFCIMTMAPDNYQPNFQVAWYEDNKPISFRLKELSTPYNKVK